MASSPSPRSAVQIAANHYVAINQLSAATDRPGVNGTVAPPAPAPLVARFLPYAPYVVSAILFVSALVIMTAGRIRTAKLNAGMLVMAVFAAAIPTMLSVMNAGLHSVTQAGPGEQPRDVRITQNDNRSVLVTWETTKEQPGIVRYGTSLADPKRNNLAGSIKTKSTDHAVLLSNLESGTTYEVEILSGSNWYSVDNIPITFTFFDLGPQ